MRKNIGLYRGKRTDGEGLVCGYLSTKTICVSGNVHFGYIIQKPSAGLYQNEWFEVDKDTIGEYTGVPDKSGNGIFEGDILKIHNDYTGDVHPFDVFVTFREGAFVCQYIGEETYTHFSSWNVPHVWWEIIGNIFDNPELITAEKSK